jgi:hypothetical protein
MLRLVHKLFVMGFIPALSVPQIAYQFDRIPLNVQEIPPNIARMKKQMHERADVSPSLEVLEWESRPIVCYGRDSLGLKGGKI